MKKIKNTFLIIGLALAVISSTGCGGKGNTPGDTFCGIFKCPTK